MKKQVFKKITPKEINKRNLAISFFMGSRYGEFKFPTGLKMRTIIIPEIGEVMESTKKDGGKLTFDLKFHLEYEWLMPVWFKIGRETNDEVEIAKNSASIKHFFNGDYKKKCFIVHFFDEFNNSESLTIWVTASDFCLQWCKENNIEIPK